jgi:acetylornithine deacetylase/succinyl-diaminopimelate desuccinylase-like protein
LTSASSAPASSGAVQLAADTVEFCSQLIRFDTSNYGGGESRGERAAAEWVAEQLSADGYAPIVLESQPQRASTVVRIAGTEPAAPALLIHGHLDVVPAQASDWSFEPFSGEVRDGAVWGRGALDMKDMDAMMLALARSFAREGFRPPRDIVLAFVADEEDTGEFGAGFLAREHPELFEGVTTAIGESGGHAVHLPHASRLYPIGTGERGSAWMRLSAHGRAGHGSRRNPENAVAILAAAISRIADYRWPVRLTPTVSALLDGLSKHLGITVDPADERSLAQLGEAARLVEATVANSLNPTMLNAGYKLNVVPSEATAGVDGRILPGLQEEFFATVDELLGDKITREFASFSAPVSASPDTTEFAAMAAAITSHDPDALVLPFCMSGGTDAKAFTSLGIACYGFAPGTTPPGFAHWEYVHGVDERVLIDSLEFGVRVLDTYLRTPPALD